jgi:hypothetical protein
MKRIIPLLLLLVSVSLSGQNINKIIKEKNVARIINTLTADGMMGRSAMDEKSINKAASFIEKEFERIGLSPLPGAVGFRQEFSSYERIETTSLSLIIDGQKVNPDNIILYADELTIKYGSNLPSTQIEKDKNFRAAIRPYLSDTTSQIIFIAPEHEKEFHEIQGYLSGSRLIEKGKARKGSSLFVLANPSTNFSIEATQSLSLFKMTNVVGVLEGKSKKDELIVFSGHYDHIGIQFPTAGDSIANGADDDASGTTAVIALAKYFKKLKNNNRTLVFVAFTAEEIGGYGSQYFSKQVNADKVVAMFNIEMIGKPSKWGPNNAFITGYERSDFGPILQKNLTGTAFQFRPDPYTEQNLFYRSDNATLARLGVPAHSISTDEIDIDKFYHTVDDEVGTLSISNLTSTIRAIALSSGSIVSGEDTPTRIDKSTER